MVLPRQSKLLDGAIRISMDLLFNWGVIFQYNSCLYNFYQAVLFSRIRSLSFLNSNSFKLRCLAIFGGTFALMFLASFFARESLSISVLIRVFVFATTIASFPIYALARAKWFESFYYFSWAIAALWMVFHGLEYMQNFLGIRTRSSMLKSEFLNSSFLLWIIVPCTAIFIHYVTVRTLFESTAVDSLVRIGIESTVMALIVLHYFLDAKIYQFKNPEVKGLVAPLFRSA